MSLYRITEIKTNREHFPRSYKMSSMNGIARMDHIIPSDTQGSVPSREFIRITFDDKTIVDVYDFVEIIRNLIEQ
jgi:hypothetical protein